MVWTMKRIAWVLAVAGWCVLAGLPAYAGSNNLAAIRSIQSLRFVDSVNVVDVAARGHDRWIFSKRAMHSNAPYTPLQVAIVSNPHLMAVIQATVWSFDLKSVYAAQVEGSHVTIYLGDPPNQ